MKNKESQEKMTVEFQKRKAIVDAALEKARLEKIEQKKKEANKKTGANLLYTGAPGFRGPGDETRGDLEKIYNNFKNKRICKTYGGQGKFTDLLTPVDAEFLFEYLIDNKGGFCNELELDDNQYKI